MFGAESGAPVSPGWDGCVSQSGAISLPPSVTDQPGVTEGSGEIKARHIRPAVAADPTSPACHQGQNPTSPPLLPWGTSEWHRWHVLHCTGAITPPRPTCPHTLSHRNVPGRQSQLALRGQNAAPLNSGAELLPAWATPAFHLADLQPPSPQAWGSS